MSPLRDSTAAMLRALIWLAQYGDHQPQCSRRALQECPCDCGWSDIVDRMGALVEMVEEPDTEAWRMRRRVEGA